MAALNCGRACREVESQLAILQSAEIIWPGWTLLFLCEVDAVRGSCREVYDGSHTCERHWPGPGSLPLTLYVHRLRRHWVKSVCWQGRAVRVHLLSRQSDGVPSLNLSVIFTHIAHGEDCPDSMADLAYLIRSRPRGSKVSVLGDINVDQLPSLSADPFHSSPSREQHHKAERMRLENFCDGLNLEVVVPEYVEGCPGGPFRDDCMFAPISRIPVGLLLDLLAESA